MSNYKDRSGVMEPPRVLESVLMVFTLPKTMPNTGKKRGRRSNKQALFELGQLLLNSGKMKTLEAFTFTS